MKQHKNIVSNVVFTKNRPLQLDAYLESLYRHFPSGIYQTYILYKVGVFQEEYQKVFSKYPNCIVIKEEDFHNNFLKLLNEIDTKFILFGVDDVVYFDSVDFGLINKTFDSFYKDFFGFSLRFGIATVGKGSDHIDKNVIDGQTVYSINWTQGRTPDTCYPFELCATIYRTELVKSIINNAKNNNWLAEKMFSPSSILIEILGKCKLRRKLLKRFGYFYNPNSLESWNCRWCQKNSERLPAFLFFQKQCSIAIQINMVNISTRKSFGASAECTVEALAEGYMQGYRLDIDYIARNKPSGTHAGPEYFKLIRNKALFRV